MKEENNKEEKVKIIEKKEAKKQKTLITSRVLFISVLDKIYLVILGIVFLVGTITIFKGNVASLSYGFWKRFGHEIIFLILIVILYLFMNWLYKCVSKTMLCLTKNEVYKESYIPFKRTETSIPLNKITKVTTINLFWIFRSIVIQQYHSFPLVFFTWNNEEFKDKLTELITTNKEKIENEYESKNIINANMYKYLKYIALGLASIIFLLGIVRFFAFMFSSERKLSGTYSSENNKIVLKSSGNCSIENLVSNVKKCTWTYNKDNNEVRLTYEYEYSSHYSYNNITSKGNITLKYNSNDKTLDYGNAKYTK